MLKLNSQQMQQVSSSDSDEETKHEAPSKSGQTVISVSDDELDKANGQILDMSGLEDEEEKKKEPT